MPQIIRSIKNALIDSIDEFSKQIFYTKIVCIVLYKNKHYTLKTFKQMSTDCDMFENVSSKLHWLIMAKNQGNIMDPFQK